MMMMVVVMTMMMMITGAHGHDGDDQNHIHTYIHTYIHTCMHACMHTTYIHTDRESSLPRMLARLQILLALESLALLGMVAKAKFL